MRVAVRAHDHTPKAHRRSQRLTVFPSAAAAMARRALTVSVRGAARREILGRGRCLERKLRQTHAPALFHFRAVLSFGLRLMAIELPRVAKVAAEMRLGLDV